MARILISQQAFFILRNLLSEIDIEEFPDGTIKKRYEDTKQEVEEKYNRLYDRMRYSEALKAETDKEKKALLDHYRKRKGKGMF